MSWTAYILPALCAAVLLFASVRKVKVYDSFAGGAAKALPLLKNLFPYVAAVLVLAELFEASGLSALLSRALTPAFNALGIPAKLARLVLIKPFSGSGATAVLSDLFAAYGADSYIARCACVAFGSSETVFYVSAVYFAGHKKNLLRPIAIALTANFLSVVLGCFLCRFL